MRKGVSGMTVVGLIGRIGAGKSTVARRFAELGARVVDADRIAHDVLGEDDVVRQVAAHFGKETVDAQGRVRRRAVAERVFGPTPEHARALEWLEGVVRPRVRGRIEAALATPAVAGEVVVLDVPLLVQAGWADRCDLLVVVECADEVRRTRLAARQWSAVEREAREAAWNRGYEAAALDPGKICTVDASGDLAYTLEQVDCIWSRLPGPAATAVDRG
ncbi:MAG: Dephospho-CoA kinase [Planctomycetota bacterium]|jgi:dephospho-CoA kinase